MPSNNLSYDLIVIGGGSAGLTAAAAGLHLGAHVALIDRRALGGECLWTGCVPSKSLIAAARAAHQARALDRFGLSGSLGPVDLDAVMDRVQKVIATIERGENADALRARGVDVHIGDARFLDPHTLDVDRRRLHGRAFIICTGSHASVPPILGLDAVTHLTNETLFDLRRLPDHLIVAGGGPQGVEMAQAFRRLGSRVTVLVGPRGLLPREDRESSAAVAAFFAREDITVHRTKITSVAGGEGASDAIHVSHEGGTIDGDALLIALGRTPNVDGLGLEAAGVAYDHEHGIQVDPYLRTTAGHILACGDVTGPYLFTHAAGFQAATAVRNALLPALKSKPALEPMSWTTFTDPEIARAGLTEDEARRTHGDEILVLRSSFAHVDRARCDDQAEGFVKLIVLPWRGTILGGHIVGAHAGELIQEVTLAMRHGLSASALGRTIHVYPTLSMGVQSAALSFLGLSRPARLLRRPLRALVRRAPAS